MALIVSDDPLTDPDRRSQPDRLLVRAAAHAPIRTADNKQTELGEWDEATLRDQITGLLAEDDVPEPPVTPVSVAGDLWQLGAHRLICGDSTSADMAGQLSDDVKPLLMVTDPPYGVEYGPSWGSQVGAAKTKRTGKVLNDDRADWRECDAVPRRRGLFLARLATCHDCGGEPGGGRFCRAVADHLGQGPVGSQPG